MPIRSPFSFSFIRVLTCSDLKKVLPVEHDPAHKVKCGLLCIINTNRNYNLILAKESCLLKNTQTSATNLPTFLSTIYNDTELLHGISDKVRDGIFIVDLQGKCIYANPACINLLGFGDAAEILGKNMHLLIHNKHHQDNTFPENECRIKQAFIDIKNIYLKEEMFYRFDGSGILVEFWSMPIIHEGKKTAYTGIFTVTDQRQLAEFARFPEMNPGPVLRLDLKANVIMSNTAAQKIFGSSLNGSCWKDICPQIDSTIWKNILRAKEPVALERTIDDKEMIFHHHRDIKSNLIFVYGTDVTDQKRTERNLHQTDELVRLLLNSTGEGIYGIDINGNCTFANPACAKLVGAESPEALIGKQLHKLIHRLHPDGKPCSLEESRIFKALMQDKGTHVDDEMMFRSDNSSFPVEYWSYPVKREGKLIGCVVTFMDISERKRSEQLQADYTTALAEIASFPEMNPGPVLRIDIKGEVLMANEAAHNLFGVEHIGKKWRDLCPDIDDATWDSILKTETIALERNIGKCDYIFTHRRDFNSDYIFIFGADVTDQKQAERALQQTEKMAALGKLSAGLAHELNNPAAAVGRAADQLLSTLDKLQSATNELYKTSIDADLREYLTERVNNFRSRTNHLPARTPMEISDQEEELQNWFEAHGIENAWEIASTMVTTGIEKKDMEDIRSAFPENAFNAVLVWMCHVITTYNLADSVVSGARSISSLINVVKSYSHMDQAPSMYVDIHKGIEDTLTLLSHKLNEGIAISREYGQNLPKIQVQGSEFNQVWTNLIENAITAMGEKGQLNIQTYQEDIYLVVEIADSGTGIPDIIQSRIFEPFFTTKDVGEGTGLGLDVVNRIVTKQCNGLINFDSRPGRTVFKVCIPINAPLENGSE